MYRCGQIPVCHIFYKRLNSPGLDRCLHFDPDDLVRFPWKAKETEISVTQTCWSWSTLWLMLPVCCVNPCYFMTAGFKYTSSPFSLIQSMLHVFSHFLANSKQNRTVCAIFPNVSIKKQNKKKHSNAKKQKKKCTNLLEHVRRIPTFFFFFFFLNIHFWP